MNLNQLRKRLILALKNEDPDIRKVAVRELSSSQVPDRYRILENWSKFEKDPSISIQIEDILQNADWFEESPRDTKESNLDQKQKKILANLASDDLELIKKTFTFLTKNRRVDFLSHMLRVEKRFDESYLKFCNIRLLTSLGQRSFETLKTYLEYPDREVQRVALDAIANFNSPECIQFCLVESYRLGPNFIELMERFLSKWNLNTLLEVIQELTEDSDSQIRVCIAYWCAKIPHKISFDCCQILIGDDDRLVVQMAWSSIERLSQNLEEAKQILSQVGSRSNADKLTENKRRVHRVKSSQYSFENLLKQFEQGDLRQKASTIQKIGFLDSADDFVINFLKDCTNDEDFRIRANALEALDQLEPYTDTEVLLKCLKDEHNRVIGNACIALYNTNDRDFFTDIYGALNQLGDSNFEAPRLTLVFCVDQIRDERFLPLIRTQFKQQKFELVRERSVKLLEEWSEDSPNVLYELEEWKRSFQIKLDEEEPLDEFID